MIERHARRLVALSLATLLAACEGRGVAPGARVATPVQVSASLAGSAVAWLSIEATASDIAVPVVATLDATGTTGRGTVVVPSGPARTVTARGYDAEGTLTHRAAATVDVLPGTGATLSLVLLPVTDAGPGSSGDDRVTTDVADVTLAVGATRRLTATVTHADGSPVANPAVTWATLAPAVATVSRTGLVSAVAPGSTQVVATSGGGAAVVTVEVR